MNVRFFLNCGIVSFILLSVWAGIVNAGNTDLSDGQTLYVPAYSYIYTGNRETHSLLTVTLSIRNTDPVRSMCVTKVDYYETQGKLIKEYITKPITLPALGSVRYIVPHKDSTGGSGANFIVRWKTSKPINPPIVETIMVGGRTSFSSRGQVIVTY